MTCVVGLEHGGLVYIGADSAAVSRERLRIRSDPKAFRVGPYVMGFTTSFRMGDVLRYSFVPPDPPSRGLERFMATAFVNTARAAFKEAGIANSTSGVESCGAFLVGVRGRLFTVESDYQVGVERAGFHAVGSGDQVALGALFASRNAKDPRSRVRMALAAAERFTSDVRRPWRVVGGGER
ncbi:MAG: hypothetical protein JW751_27555 [Polyangiaceae bacterium]|nr:hypothetical protein [Polyangiaceae bacterium]